MKKKLIINTTILIVFILLITSISPALLLKDEKSYRKENENTNRQIYLGYASINGNGTSSNLFANAENIRVGVGSPSEIVDFYIDYNMLCSGLVDQGTIGLGIMLNGINVSDTKINVATTFNSKNGSLIIDGIEVKRGDVIVFTIQVIYLSAVHPGGGNRTDDLGGVTFSKSVKLTDMLLKQPIMKMLERNLNFFSIVKKILKF